MTYNPNIPQSADLISDSQSDLLNNFGVADSAMNRNHIPFSDNSSDSAGLPNRGKHTNAVFRQQAGDPTTADDEDALYVKSVVYPGPVTRNEFFMRTAANDLNQILQFSNFFTNVIIGAAHNPIPGNTTSGSSFIPGGLVVKWGQVQLTGATTINFVTDFTPSLGAYPNTLFSVVATLTGAAVGFVNVSSFTTSSFIITPSVGGVQLATFYAIGN